MKLLVIFGLLGLAYGAVLQRSGFCFVRAAYELFLLRSRDALSGVAAGLLVATLGFATVTMLRTRAGLPSQEHLLILPFGFGTAMGGALFGVGMTLAGMCAAGTLQRLGEGHVIAWMSLLGMIVGAAFDPFRAVVPVSLQLQSSGVWLGAVAGAPTAAAITLAVILIAWRVIGGKHAFRRRNLLSPTVLGGTALGLLSTLQMSAAAPWTVAYPLGLVPPAFSASLSHRAISNAAPLLVLDGGVVLGALLATATRERYHLRWPRKLQQVVIVLVGGILMGWGIQLARGCSIGGGFSALPSLSVSGWIFLPCLFLGGWIGARMMRVLT